MTGLFNENLCSVLASCLEGFTKDWVEWLLNKDVIVHLRDVGCQTELQAFEWVSGLSCSIVEVN